MTFENRITKIGSGKNFNIYLSPENIEIFYFNKNGVYKKLLTKQGAVYSVSKTNAYYGVSEIARFSSTKCISKYDTTISVANI